MKIKQINEINPTFNYIEQILHNRNIDKKCFADFIDMRYTIYDPILLKNIKEAAKCLIKHIQNNSNIYIIVDSDTDGYTSASGLWIYLKRLSSNIRLKYIMHEGKQHGIILDNVPEDTDLLIVPDGGSNDVKQCISLKEKNIDVIVLDHHLFDFDEDNPAIIVNCQDDSYPNKHLCGAGVVYQFCRYLDSMINQSYSDEIIDLVALGLDITERIYLFS